MAIKSLNDLYVNELKDMRSADKQSLAITKRLQKKAKNEELKSALTAAIEGIERGLDAMETLLKSHGEKTTGQHCKGMEGLVTEAKKHVFEEKFGSDALRDSMIICQYQRMTHYALVGYGSSAAYAKALGLKSDHATLKQCLDGTYDGDRHMTNIATTHVTQEAAKTG